MVKELPGLEAFAQVVLVALVTLLVGFLAASKIFPKFSRREKVLIAYPVFFLYVYLMYLVNLLLGGAIFSNSGLVLMISAFTALTILLYNNMPHGIHSLYRFLANHKSQIFILIIGLIVFCQPIYLLSNGVITLSGDMARYINITSQLLAGNPTPFNVYKELGVIDYPWLFNAALSTLTNIYNQDALGQIQGIFQAYNTLAVITIIWGSITLYSLASQIFKEDKTKINASLIFGFLAGGLNIISENNGVFTLGVDKPFRAIDFPYNAVITQIPPTWPRHIGYVAYISAIYFMIKLFDDKVEENRKQLVLWAGLTLGISGLLQPVPVLITGVAMALLFFYRALKKKIQWEIPIVGAVAAIFLSPWLITFIVERVNAEATTNMGAVDLPYWQIILTLAQTLIAAIIGIAFLIRSRDGILSKLDSVLSFHAILLLILIILSNISSITGYEPVLFGEYFFRQHRFWFLLYPIMALYAGYGFGEIMRKMEQAQVDKLEIKISWKEVSGERQINWTSILYIIIVITGLIGPAFTASAAVNELVANGVPTEYLNKNENLLTALNARIKPGETVAAPTEITSSITTYTAANVFYSRTIRSNLTGLSIPSQSERLNDLTTLLARRSTNQQRDEVIKKYQVTYIISTTRLNFSTTTLVETNRGTLGGVLYYIYRVDYTKIGEPNE